MRHLASIEASRYASRHMSEAERSVEDELREIRELLAALLAIAGRAMGMRTAAASS